MANMRYGKLVVVLCGAVLLCGVSARAREPLQQLGRGISNVLTGVVEIPKNVHAVNQDKGGVAALTFGVLRGSWRFLIREAVGVYEIATFPMGWRPIIEPEYPFEPSHSTDWRMNPDYRKRR